MLVTFRRSTNIVNVGTTHRARQKANINVEKMKSKVRKCCGWGVPIYSGSMMVRYNHPIYFRRSRTLDHRSDRVKTFRVLFIASVCPLSWPYPFFVAWLVDRGACSFSFHREITVQRSYGRGSISFLREQGGACDYRNPGNWPTLQAPCFSSIPDFFSRTV